MNKYDNSGDILANGIKQLFKEIDSRPALSICIIFFICFAGFGIITSACDTMMNDPKEVRVIKEKQELVQQISQMATSACYSIDENSQKQECIKNTVNQLIEIQKKVK